MDRHLDIQKNVMKEIIKKMSEERHPVSQIKRSLNKLVELKYLNIVKKRPITYSVEESYLRYSVQD